VLVLVPRQRHDQPFTPSPADAKVPDGARDHVSVWICDSDSDRIDRLVDKSPLIPRLLLELKDYSVGGVFGGDRR
jgi:hypothetical protein